MILGVPGCIVVLLIPYSTAPQTRDSGVAPTLVIGFVGGFVHSDDLRNSEAQIARQWMAMNVSVCTKMPRPS